jgi:hypothetical protein
MRGSLDASRVEPLVRPPADLTIQLARPQHPRHAPRPHPSCLKRYNAADNAPPRTRLITDSLLGGRVQPLVRPPFGSGIQPTRPYDFAIRALCATTFNPMRYNSANNPPAYSRLMRGTLQRVGCIGLFGGDTTPLQRGARRTCDTPVAQQPAGLNHASLARRNLFLT